MSDFDLTRGTTYAKLSPADLKLMAKRASQEYLSCGTPLEDAIVKVAKETPSISSHQIRRVTEFANQETFESLFQKQAGDKNIDFDVADPGNILHEINAGARPMEVTPMPEEFAADPVKMSHVAVEQDYELARAFGVELVSPRAEETVIKEAHGEMTKQAFVTGRILGHQPLSAVDRLYKMAMDAAAPPAEPMAPEEPSAPQQHPEVTHRENMRAMERRVEIEKKKQELVAMQAKGMQGQGDGGGAPAPGGEPPPGGDPAAGGAPPPMEGAPPEGGMPPEEGMPPEGMPPEGAPPPAGPPQGLPGGGPMPMAPPPDQLKQSSVDLTKQAMSYAKSNRPRAMQVLDDLRAGASIEMIKAATAEKHESDVNPHRNLLETKQKVARLIGGARAATDKNFYLQKEATERFQRQVRDHMLEGGNFGEVGHLMSHIHNDPMHIKTALEASIPELLKHGFKHEQLQSEAIRYEMKKEGHVREVNMEHPLANAYADLVKIKEAQLQLDVTLLQLQSDHDELQSAIGQVLQQNASSI